MMARTTQTPFLVLPQATRPLGEAFGLKRVAAFGIRKDDHLEVMQQDEGRWVPFILEGTTPVVLLTYFYIPSSCSNQRVKKEEVWLIAKKKSGPSQHSSWI